MLKGWVVAVAVLTYLGAFVQYAAAQETTATIHGVVTDSSGSVLPGVTITVRHQETSQTRTVVTEADGRYRVPALALGAHEITAQLEGFQTMVRSGVVLTVGMDAAVNIQLKVGQVSEQIVVTAGAPLVETSLSTVSHLVDEKQMRALPLNGRSFDQLALMQPGVSTMPFVGADITSGTSKEVVISGSRWGTTLFMLDGTEMNEGRNAGSASGNILGVESVQEFRVLTQNFNAELGRASGGIISAVTRSGTNRLQGSGYEFFRNDALDARNYFDVGEKPSFTRHQFGGAAGGPIVKDHAFFFVNVEALRERLGETNVAIVPLARVHDGLIADPSRPGQLVQVPLAPIAKTFLDTMYPLPNAGEIAGTDGGFFESNPTRFTDDTYLTFKIDQVLSGRHKYFVRYTHDNSKQVEDLTIPVSRTSGTIAKHLMTFEDTLILTPRILNTFRFGFNRDKARDSVEDIIQVGESLKFVPGLHIGNFRVPGFDTVGEGGSLPRYVLNTLLDFSNDLTIDTGGHSLKMGLTVKRYRSDTQFSRRNNGRYDFASLQDFLIGRARRFEAPLPNTDTERRWRQWLVGAYVQDDITLGSRVRANIGVRYEPYTRPLELDGKMANLVDPLGGIDDIVTGEFFHENPSLKNIQPRVGVVWDVFGDGRTSLRSAYGIFQNPLLPSTYALDGTRIPPFFQSATLNNPPFPNAYDVYLNEPARLVRAFDVTRYEPGMGTPSYNKWHVTLEREIASAMRVSLGYSGNKGYNLIRQYEGNTVRPTILADGSSFFPGGGALRNPNWNSILTSATDVSSNYHAMNLSVVRRMSDGLQAQVAYTWSKHRDNGSGTLGGTLQTQGAASGLVSSDPDNLDRDWGLSAWDRRHNFVFSATYELPFGARRRVPLSGALDQLLGGWALNTIVTLSSGVPLNVVIGTFDNLRNRDSRTPSRPSLAAGASNNPVVDGGRNPARYFDPTAFVLPPAGTYGNLGRNTLISPGVALVDLALAKTTRVALFDVELRVEAFNLLNRANFGQPGRQIFAPNGTYLADAGVITSTTTPSRQMQLGVRLSF